MKWDVIDGNDGSTHVVPDKDMRPHRHSVDCWCRPVVDSEGVIIHHAMDNREQYEGKPH